MTVPRIWAHGDTVARRARADRRGLQTAAAHPLPAVASAELYDPASGTFTSTGSMSEARSGHTAMLLADGTVLVTGTDRHGRGIQPRNRDVLGGWCAVDAGIRSHGDIA